MKVQEMEVVAADTWRTHELELARVKREYEEKEHHGQACNQQIEPNNGLLQLNLPKFKSGESIEPFIAFRGYG